MFILHGSSRENGNTESIINLLLEGIEAERIYLREKNILPIVDKRHDPEGFPQRHDEYEEIAKKCWNTTRLYLPHHFTGME